MVDSGQDLIADIQEPAIPAPKSDSNDRIRKALDAARRRLLTLQRDDGHWCAELEGDTILESEYVLCLYFLGLHQEERARLAANYLRAQQMAEGGWNNYPGGPPDVSATVKAYLVLKLMGDDPEAPHMARARRVILDHGGLDACNSFTKIYLAIFGEYAWSRCPAVPPEMILLPLWAPFNVYAMSSWSRAIVVPLSIIWAVKPSCPLPAHARSPELRTPAGWRPPAAEPASLRRRLWGGLFRAISTGCRWLDAARVRPWRRRALRRCQEWIGRRLEKSDGLGAIFPPIINTLIAFRALGHAMDHPVIRGQLAELEKLEIRAGETLRVQPCLSPVWDTALALSALLDAGVDPSSPEVLEAARWLLRHEVGELGDVRKLHPQVPVGGWYFEYANEYYPDCDDTSEVIQALIGVRFPDPQEDLERRLAIDRGLAWLHAMQNDDGGWGAFDRGCENEIFTFIPFADHNAMIDPSTSDITSRCVETLCHVGERTSETVSRGIRFLETSQEADGSWYGRWGCNYLYGTWLALRSLEATGCADPERVRRAAAWLRGVQNPDGGWGELPASYDDPSKKGDGPSTAAQTAWALMGLFAAGDASSPAVERGLQYLLRTQGDDGAWFDVTWTGTGFPKVFYLRYHYYSLYFPLQALAEHTRRTAGRVFAETPELIAAA